MEASDTHLYGSTNPPGHIPLTPLTRDGRYEILGPPLHGAMGRVYRARDSVLGRTVAIKVLQPGASSERFLREARLLALVKSAHVVAVHDFAILEDGSPLLVMEWVDGGSLRDLLQTRGSPLTEVEMRTLMQHVCRGMQDASEYGIVHRDLKPSNILLGPRAHAIVADFGLARGSNVLNELSLGRRDLLGTPHYMAPEQAEDPQGADVRADIYSCGATFYHLATGAPPFDGGTAFTVLYKHKTEPLTAPKSINPALSPHFGEILERCLAKSPADRFATFGELQQCLESSAQSASPWVGVDDPLVRTHLARFETRRDVYLHRADELLESDVYRFENGRELRVLYGDIARQSADALVSSDDSDLSMGAGVQLRGVARALLVAAGPELATEARRFAPVRPGRVIVTSAGALPARFVFHGITLGPLQGPFVSPSRDLILEILGSCFYHADTLGVRSLAMPLLGTGTAGFSKEICLDTIFRCLCRTLARGLTPVRDAAIVLYERRPE